MTSQLPTIVVDSDALIGLFYDQDAHAQEALDIAQKLQSLNAKLIYPATTIIETVTTLQRKLQRPDVGKQIMALVGRTPLIIEPVDSTILAEALGLFDPDGSKKNTLFDAVVAAIAAKVSAKAIFSFDGWYEKQGFTLARQVV